MQRNRSLFLGLIAIIALFTACSKDNDKPAADEYLLVTPNTTLQVSDTKMTVYKVSAEGSYRALIDLTYTFEGTEIHFTSLDRAWHDSLKNFLFTLPLDSLKASNMKVFGCPGCADGPAWLLGYKTQDGEFQEWRIAYDAVPAYLQSYLEDLYRVTRNIE